uniref:Uncharacterized protein n=1 Tax=Globodera rostochiensis TaxID=31243 RepID=A0A914HA95_GLORO
MRSNIIVHLLLLVILAFCYGMDNETEPNDFQSFVNRDIRINATNSGSLTAPPPANFYNWVGTHVQMAIDQLSDTTYVNSDNGHFKSIVQTLTSQPKATPGLAKTSDSFQQPESASFQPQLRPDQLTWMKKDKPKATPGLAETSSQQRESTIALIRSLINTKTHLKPNSGPSTAPIMPAQNSAMLYNSTGRTSMPMSHHQSSGTNFFMADTNNSRSFVQQNSTGNNDLGGSGPLQSRGTTADGEKKRNKKGKHQQHVRASSSNSAAAGVHNSSSFTSNNNHNYSMGSQPFPTAHGQSSAALALPGDAGGTLTAFQSNQSSSNATMH